MARKPRADDDEDINVCLGTGCIGQLRDSAPRCKRVSRPIGFVHFPERRERKAKPRAAKRKKPARNCNVPSPKGSQS
jgi:hypothetical protein